MGSTLDTYSDPCKISKMFDRILNVSLDYVSYFAMVLREIHENVDVPK